MTAIVTVWVMLNSIVFGVGVFYLVRSIVAAMEADPERFRFIPHLAGWCWMCASISISFNIMKS